MTRMVTVRNSRNLYKITSIVAIALSFLGCVMLPYPHHMIYEGKEIKEQSLAWLEPGVTSQEQVVKLLGVPNIDFVGRNAVAYQWSGQVGAVLVITLDTVDSFPITMREALLILYDESGKVIDYAIVKRPRKPLIYDYRGTPPDAKDDDWRVILDKWLQVRRDMKPINDTDEK